jgi:magnesium transporter
VAIDYLQQSSDVEMVFYIYVINDAGQLVGVLSLWSLLTVLLAKKVAEIMITDFLSVRTDVNKEAVAGC